MVESFVAGECEDSCLVGSEADFGEVVVVWVESVAGCVVKCGLCDGFDGDADFGENAAVAGEHALEGCVSAVLVACNVGANPFCSDVSAACGVGVEEGEREVDQAFVEFIFRHCCVLYACG